MELEEAFAYGSFRPGQRELAARVREGCLAGELLMAEAVSGFGKTAAVLTGAVAAAEEAGCRVVYACRTKRQILRVVEELSRLQRKHRVEAAPMLSKFDYCLLKETSPRKVPQASFGWYCWFNVHNNLCSYFLNVGLPGGGFGEAVRAALDEAPTHQQLLERARALHVCPYEVERLAVVQARLAVVPYSYVFDPATAPALFGRAALDRAKTLLVVDEAHNLRDFMRGVNSAVTTLDQIKGAAAEARGLLMDRAAAALEELGGVMRSEAERTRGWRLDRDAVLERVRGAKGASWLQNLAYELTACSEAAWGAVALERRLPSLLLDVGRFLVRLTSSPGAELVKWDQTLALIDPDPVRGLSAYLQGFRGAVLVSATISPSEVFARSLGIAGASPSAYRAGAEPTVTVLTVVETGVTTRYKERTPGMYSRIADKVAAVASATPSGVGVFAPSYSVLEPLRDMVAVRLRGRPVLSEVRGMSTGEAADLFESMKARRGSVVFAVQGGRFSEGEDFRDDQMEAVVVVGLSLPPPSPMLYAEYACLKRAGEEDSYLMLSRLPALRKAFQAAGRHIRSPGKRGVVVLMDSRFDAPAVRDLMPSWMKRELVSGDFSPAQLQALSAGFWGPPRAGSPS